MPTQTDLGRAPAASLLAALLATACTPGEAAEAPASRREPGERPSFVVVLVDDLGWRDPGYAGSTFHATPHVDALAAESMVFTRAYAASPVCSPTRASLLTGRVPARLGLTGALTPRVYGREGDVRTVGLDGEVRVRLGVDHLAEEEVTLAEDLREAGYATVLVGKWHLGPPGHDPRDHGFDEAIAWSSHGPPPGYFTPHGIEGFEDGPPGEYLTDRLTDEAIAAIERVRDRPFFVLLSHWAVHTPLHAPREEVARFQERARELEGREDGQRNPVYAAMLARVDDGVGRLRAALQRLGLAERTVVVFLSDNGGADSVPADEDDGDGSGGRPPPTSNAPLRGGKGFLYEGGLRVPWLIHVPGDGPAGAGSRCDVPVISCDLYPTLRELAGLPPRPAHAIDGLSLAGLLRGCAPLEREALYFYYPSMPLGAKRRKGNRTAAAAVMVGDERLVHYFGGHTELYDLAADPGERHDLSAERPGRAGELRARLLAWLDDVGLVLPVVGEPAAGETDG